MFPKKIGLLLWCFAFSLSLSAEHLTIIAKKGDGAYSILREYGLLEFPCNLAEFYRLNKLKKNAGLHAGRTYKLPIDMLTYNGKSIRTTTNNKNYDRAVDIQHYNEDLLQKGVRAKDFREDKMLWVPFHIDNCPRHLRSKPLRPCHPPPNQPLHLRRIRRLRIWGRSQSLRPFTTDKVDIPKQDGPRPGGRPTGPAPEQQTTSRHRTFDIFGDKYAYVPKVDNKLAGRIFYIVAGHGGPDPGASARRGSHKIYEDEYAYDVALRLTRNILAHGGTPYMIVRDDTHGIRDEKYLKADKTETVWGGVSIPLNQKKRLWQRCDVINSLYEQNIAKGLTDQTMISIHVDSRHKSKRVDLFFYHHENDVVGEKKAEQMRNVIKNMYATTRAGRGYDGTVRARDLHVLRETKPSGVFIELANMANPSDQLRIIEPANRQLIADWLVMGLY